MSTTFYVENKDIMTFFSVLDTNKTKHQLQIKDTLTIKWLKPGLNNKK